MEVKLYYRISEVARLLSVSARSIKRATNNGKIPCTKISDKVTLISSSDVEKLKQKQVIRKYNKSSKPKLPQKIKSSLPDPKPELRPEKLPIPKPSQDNNRTGELCPECGQATLINEEGCRKCYTCGYSEC